MTRRALMASAAAVAGGTLLARGVEPSRAAATGSGFIDVHHHLTSPKIIAFLKERGDYVARLHGVTPEQSVEEMDRDGARASINTMMGTLKNAEGATYLALVRDANEWLARVTADHPGRFGFFAEMPMPDIDATLNEIAYALDTLKADGVKLATSEGDKWLGDPAFAPIYEELNRRGAVVYTHPGEDACCRPKFPDLQPAVIEFGTSTTRAIARMLFSGAAAKYGDMRLIFSHAGGTFPYLMERFVLQMGTKKAKAAMPNGLEAEVTRFYYDTAQSFHPAPLGALHKVVPATQILFGTDWPYRSVAQTMGGVAASGEFTRDELGAIGSGNAVRLLARFTA